VAKGLLGVGALQKKQAMSGLTQAAGLEAQQDIAEEQLYQQRKAAQAQTTGTMTAVGAYVGAGTAVGGVPGAVIGFLIGKLFG